VETTESITISDASTEPVAITENVEIKGEEVAVESEMPVSEEQAIPVTEQVTEPVAFEAGSNWPPEDIDLHQAVPVETKSEPLPSWLAEESLLELIDEVVEEFISEEAREENIAPQEPVTEVPVEAKTEQEETPAPEEVAEVQQNVSVHTSSTTMEMVETYTEFTSTALMTPSTLEDTQPIKIIKKVELTIHEETVDETPVQPEVQKETNEVVQEASVEEESTSVAESLEAEESSSAITSEAAYEEYLKDAVEPVSTLSDHIEDVHSGTPMTKVSESGDVRIAMDTQNAHVWNELGNVYFNSGSCDDAISAYGKAIELDRQFAWPYSNLALAYVQKERFAEAILLYQRSIELFVSDKDKAVTWNRLGNVYRRLNDYSHAISAYQTADDLDPDNATLSLRSHYGLLGNLYMDQKPNYVS
jgi:tetratricopeptide (TPR) repeat protein